MRGVSAVQIMYEILMTKCITKISMKIVPNTYLVSELGTKSVKAKSNYPRKSTLN
jgi:hypothetical protein